MLKLLPFFMMPVGLTGCGVLSAFSSPPPRFTQFGESALTSTGSFESPQWSRDGRYLAYLDTTHDPALVVYDTLDKVSWTAATNISTVHFSWTPDGHLTYLRYRPDLSGSPYPTIHDLHQVDFKWWR
jgi:Tol biopolymer transport system component